MNAHASAFKTEREILLRMWNGDAGELVGASWPVGPSPVRIKVKRAMGVSYRPINGKERDGRKQEALTVKGWAGCERPWRSWFEKNSLAERNGWNEDLEHRHCQPSKQDIFPGWALSMMSVLLLHIGNTKPVRLLDPSHWDQNCRPLLLTPQVALGRAFISSWPLLKAVFFPMYLPLCFLKL